MPCIRQTNQWSEALITNLWNPGMIPFDYNIGWEEREGEPVKLDKWTRYILALMVNILGKQEINRSWYWKEWSYKETYLWMQHQMEGGNSEKCKWMKINYCIYHEVHFGIKGWSIKHQYGDFYIERKGRHGVI